MFSRKMFSVYIGWYVYISDGINDTKFKTVNFNLNFIPNKSGNKNKKAAKPIVLEIVYNWQVYFKAFSLFFANLWATSA